MDARTSEPGDPAWTLSRRRAGKTRPGADDTPPIVRWARRRGCPNISRRRTDHHASPAARRHRARFRISDRAFPAAATRNGYILPGTGEGSRGADPYLAVQRLPRGPGLRAPAGAVIEPWDEVREGLEGLSPAARAVALDRGVRPDRRLGGLRGLRPRAPAALRWDRMPRQRRGPAGRARGGCRGNGRRPDLAHAARARLRGDAGPLSGGELQPGRGAVCPAPWRLGAACASGGFRGPPLSTAPSPGCSCRACRRARVALPSAWRRSPPPPKAGAGSLVLRLSRNRRRPAPRRPRAASPLGARGSRDRGRRRPSPVYTAWWSTRPLHCAAGLATVFNRFCRRLRSALRAAARFWIGRAVAMRRPGEGIGGFLAWLPGPGGELAWRADPGFLTGAAGVGLALLAAVSPVVPAWDRVLLMSPPDR